MLPFCGYNMGDYFAHWLSFAKTSGAALPKIYFVNWFRKGEDGKFVWPGFGENTRVLKWVVERLEGKADAHETPIGMLPTRDSLDTSGLSLTDDELDMLLSVDAEVWREEASLIPGAYEQLGDAVPQALWTQYETLKQRLEV